MRTKKNRCYECGGEMKERSTYYWQDDFLGKMQVEAEPEEYFFCAECSSEELSYSLMKKIEAVEQERTEQLLLQSVGGNMKVYKENLVRNKDLVDLLGKTRQAIQQDHKIKTLIFHHVEKSGEIVYWRPSVEQYKKTGDGRYDLRQYLTSRLTASTDDQSFMNPVTQTETGDTFIEIVPLTRRGTSQCHSDLKLLGLSNLGWFHYDPQSKWETIHNRGE